jgi:alpha-tubulin suppressor-like RCC1 family protein
LRVLWSALVGILVLVAEPAEAGTPRTPLDTILTGGSPAAAAFAWGDNTAGALGVGVQGVVDVPAPIVATGALSGKNVTAITGGDASGCALAGGAAYCWGQYNGSGHAGSTGIPASPSVPVAVDTNGVLKGRVVTSISSGGTHTCVVADGLPFCWGDSEYGVLGNPGSPFEVLVPQPVDVRGVLKGKTIQSISAGTYSTCALADHQVYCWGSNLHGGLGNHTFENSEVPVAVDMGGALAGKTVTAVQTGMNEACALASGRAYCWGEEAGNGLGTGGFSEGIPYPVPVDWTGVLAGKTATELTLGAYTGCVLASGSAYCWGGNPNGNLGAGLDASNVPSPVAVYTGGALKGLTVTKISSAQNHTCVLASTKLFCWGNDYSGELGDGNRIPTAVPVPVVMDGALRGRSITQLTAGAGSTFVVATPPPAPPVIGGAAKRVTAVGAKVTISGKAPVGSSVDIYTHERATRGYRLSAKVTADIDGAFSTSYTANDDYRIYAEVGTVQSNDVLIAVALDVAGPPARTVKKNTTSTITGTYLPSEDVTVHFHKQGTPANIYSIARTVHTNSKGQWSKAYLATVDYRFFVTGDANDTVSGRYLIQAR